MEHAVDSTKQKGPSPTKGPAARPASVEEPPLHPILQLQRQVGNQAVLAILRSGALQAKLAVSSPQDPEEKEADQVAERVMRKRAGGAVAGSCTPGGEMCEECQKKQLEAPGGTPIVQRRANTVGAMSDAPSIVRQTLGGSGRPLDSATRTDMESRFGYDFGDARIHADGQAAESAKSIDALAYTVGNNIAFGEGQYTPHSYTGRGLLAHELAHVVQQGGGVNGGSRGKDFVPVSPVTKTLGVLQRWEGLEHKKVGTRAQNEFPYRGTILTNETALRTTPRKNPTSPHDNTKADIFSGAKVLVLGKERGWVQVLVESGTARDKKGGTISAETMTGYVSHELVTKSAAVFDAEVPVRGGSVSLTATS
jgi:hypothetical protein